MNHVIVVGGGASGLAAAVSAAENGASVTVLERLPRVGKKILLTGNGRCNLSHQTLPAEHYHGSVQQADTILRRFDAAAYFERFGLFTRTDHEGRMYPASGMAASVLDALRFAACQHGVEILCGKHVTGLRQKQRKWLVFCGEESFCADAVILAAGGAAAPNCGTDGSLFPLLRNMGYQVQQPKPVLCPIPTDPARVRPMKGMRVRAAASAYLGERCCKTEIGEVQFTDNALSGICIFNLARFAAGDRKKLRIVLNLMPDHDAQEAESILYQLRKQRKDLPAGDMLTGLLPKRVAETLMKCVGIRIAEPAAAISQDQLRQLFSMLLAWSFPVTGQASFQQAQVTAGGVSGQNIGQNLESKLHKGLFFCGELTDLDGDCGGYNLAWAWASGACAGKQAAACSSKESPARKQCSE